MTRVLVVDDEEFARERLCQLLTAVPDVEVVGEAADGVGAIHRIAELRPDVVLLDIQMPGPSGLEVAACLPSPRPHIIFCTAFDQYAVDAFELNAVDYLLKPVNRIRLAKAMERARQRQAGDAERELDLVTRTFHGPALRLLARCGERYRVIQQRDVVYLSSSGGLTRVHTRDREYLLTPTLNEIESRIDPTRFYRISRSALVNLDCIVEVGPVEAGVADVTLTTNARLEVSRRRLRELLERLDGVSRPRSGSAGLTGLMTHQRRLGEQPRGGFVSETRRSSVQFDISGRAASRPLRDVHTLGSV